jgi:hypothetical protein
VQGFQEIDPMNKIVIVSDRKEDRRCLEALLRLLFPECEIRVVSPRDGAPSAHRHGAEGEASDHTIISNDSLS